jgi:hypothetical protein
VARTRAQCGYAWPLDVIDVCIGLLKTGVMPLLHLAQKQTEHMPEHGKTGW